MRAGFGAREAQEKSQLSHLLARGTMGVHSEPRFTHLQHFLPGSSGLSRPHLFLRARERVSMSGGGAEREGERESEAGSRLRAVNTEPDVGLELTTRDIMT